MLKRTGAWMTSSSWKRAWPEGPSGGVLLPGSEVEHCQDVEAGKRATEGAVTVGQAVGADEHPHGDATAGGGQAVDAPVVETTFRVSSSFLAQVPPGHPDLGEKLPQQRE